MTVPTALVADTSNDWSLPAWAVLTVAVLAALLLVLAVAIAVSESRARARGRREVAELRERLTGLEQQLTAVQTSAPEQTPAAESVRAPGYTITSLGRPEQPDHTLDQQRVTVAPAPAADALLREGVVQTASLLHGVRRALAPEARNRIAFEMKRELKRSRKARRAEVKEALREYRARHRAEVADADLTEVVEVAR